ncbi:hypothetical protein J6590_088215 [Homalodisca vitripennis]|nr:hypothetical protein J6590_088215 [Homalodisca vitripennis]
MNEVDVIRSSEARMLVSEACQTITLVICQITIVGTRIHRNPRLPLHCSPNLQGMNKVDVIRSSAARMLVSEACQTITLVICQITIVGTHIRRKPRLPLHCSPNFKVMNKMGVIRSSAARMLVSEACQTISLVICQITIVGTRIHRYPRLPLHCSPNLQVMNEVDVIRSSAARMLVSEACETITLVICQNTIVGTRIRRKPRLPLHCSPNMQVMNKMGVIRSSAARMLVSEACQTITLVICQITIVGTRIHRYPRLPLHCSPNLQIMNKVGAIRSSAARMLVSEACQTITLVICQITIVGTRIHRNPRLPLHCSPNLLVMNVEYVLTSSAPRDLAQHFDSAGRQPRWLTPETSYRELTPSNYHQ